MRTLPIVTIVAVLIVSACVQQNAPERVSFTTDDGFLIYGDYYEGGEKAVILLHMLNSSRDAWGPFPPELNRKNYTVLAIDMRGHGQSVMQYNQTRSWQDFPEDEFSNMLLDAKAAKIFLAGRGKTRFAMAGASIGSSIALNYALVDKNTTAAVMLSPGREYKGIPTDYFITLYAKPVMLIAADGDTYSAESAKYMFFFAKGRKDLVILSNSSAHGTDMLDSSLKENIISWLETNF